MLLKQVIRTLEIDKRRLEYPKTDWNNNGKLILSDRSTSLFALSRFILHADDQLLQGMKLRENLEFIWKYTSRFS